ncbi:uncharacterized protein LOC143222278 [Tachypleus tridentatus]|uniref:uncharacterized protein LOC143222278 n=1 Tax=Tachypleus tridentatus TaxID=6853 RepID=UPI003FD10A23
MPREGKGSSVVGMIQSLYTDPLKWQLVKSWTMFAFGVYLAREFADIDLMAPPPNL